LVAITWPVTTLATSILVLKVLLAASGSSRFAAPTEAEKVCKPALVGCTVRATVEEAELVRVPRLRTSTPLVSVDGWFPGETLISAVPAGSVLVSSTFGTVPGPRFVTVAV